MKTTKEECECKKKKRSVVRDYFLPVSGRRTRVCKTMFLKMLSIGEKTVRVTMNKKSTREVLEDQRGKSAPANKLTTAEMKFLTDHIKSFPCVESHYC